MKTHDWEARLSKYVGWFLVGQSFGSVPSIACSFIVSWILPETDWNKAQLREAYLPIYINRSVNFSYEIVLCKLFLYELFHQ